MHHFNLGDIHEKGFILANSGKRTTLDDYDDDLHSENYKPYIEFKSTETNNEWNFYFNQNTFLK